MSLPVCGADYVTTQLVAATDQTSTTLLVASPTEPFPLFDATHLYFYITLVDEPSYISDANPPTQREIVKVTAYAVVSTGYSLTCVRGSAGTNAQIWAVGAVAEIRPCAQWFEDVKGDGGGGGAPVDATYVTMSSNTTLTNERVLTAGTNITITDNGANNTVVIAAAGGSSGGGGALQSEAFTTSGTFTVPDGVTGLWIGGIGGGGGGFGSGGSGVRGGGGGGGGEEGNMVPLTVSPSDVITITIGASGAGGAAGTSGIGNNGATGGTTSVGPYSFLGGVGGHQDAGGYGGGPRGGVPTNNAAGITGSGESTCYFGGSCGGACVNAGSAGLAGGGSGGYLVGGAGGAITAGVGGGGGGAATVYGIGGAGGAGNAAGVDASASAYGAGGGGAGAGATGSDGGDGAPGYATIFWIG